MSVSGFLRIFGLQIDEVTWSWRKLHNDELHNLHPPTNIVMMMKSGTIRWAGHVAHWKR
jgi:hypothetical protein